MSSKYELYLNAYNKTLEGFDRDKCKDEDIISITKKLVLYGVKAINNKIKKEYNLPGELERRFEFIDITKDLMGTLTPKEFMNVFPIEKDYDGHKYGAKDYFYTRDYIQTLEQGEPIGEEILNFLWEYQNDEILEFSVEMMSCVSDLRRMRGKPSIMEEFAAKNGIKMYSMQTDDNGNEYLLDPETGKTARLQKKRHLHIVK
ncbi:phage infection protein [Halocella sp. SP3-1]|uniref:phage infection protein n=1 Tax=Halocella sp. SP3-1 TaxID=2382161 RepID=UPI000F75DE7F|nr:phage infection protein [Halocella sp. SP3-1]AZO96185.1 phage infection protein [Halocella sp. SP3-1]